MKKSILSLTITTSLAVCCIVTPARGLSSEAENLLDACIKAYEAEAARSRSGTGIASVFKSYGSTGKEKDIEDVKVQFWFKDQARRSDFHTPNSNISSDSLVRSSVDNGEFCYGYRQFADIAYVRRSGVSGFKDEAGQDFHPDVFMTDNSGISLCRIFSNLKTNPDFEVQVRFNEKGLLEITATYQGKVTYDGREVNEESNVHFLLDPKHSYRVLEYRNEQRNVNGLGSVEINDMQVSWQDYGPGEAYPKSVKSYGKRVRSIKSVQNPPEGSRDWDREVESNMRIDVNDFSPNIEIPDDLFTLAGIGVKKGTKIDDIVTGIIYFWGATKVDEASLESLLDDSNAPDLSVLDSQDEANEQEASPPIELSKEDAVLVEVAPDKKATSLIAIISVGVIGAAMAAILWKRRIGRN